MKRVFFTFLTILLLFFPALSDRAIAGTIIQAEAMAGNLIFNSDAIYQTANPQPVFDTDRAQKKKTVAAIREKAKAYSAKFTGNPFAVQPSIKTPYKTGSLNKAFIQDAVNQVNFYRFIANLPDDVTADAALNLNAQHGAVLLAKTGKLSHTPLRPEDMPFPFYNQGYQAASTSNICFSCGFLRGSVDMYMEDSGPNNLSAVGHRRWILNPELKKTGFGMASAYSVMKAFDSSRSGTQEVKWRAIPWPASGYMPIELFSTKTPWSISLNTNLFAAPESEKIQVKLIHLKTKKTWAFTAKTNAAKNAGNYFTVSIERYGGWPAIIFRPGQLPALKNGDNFEVTVTGLKTCGGKADSLTYQVWFFNL